jgi:hypothetical protein
VTGGVSRWNLATIKSIRGRTTLMSSRWLLGFVLLCVANQAFVWAQ